MKRFIIVVLACLLFSACCDSAVEDAKSKHEELTLNEYMSQNGWTYVMTVFPDWLTQFTGDYDPYGRITLYCPNEEYLGKYSYIGSKQFNIYARELNGELIKIAYCIDNVTVSNGTRLPSASWDEHVGYKVTEGEFVVPVEYGILDSHEEYRSEIVVGEVSTESFDLSQEIVQLPPDQKKFINMNYNLKISCTSSAAFYVAL